MASVSKRSWKLQDFMAHKANVNCLALGHKSGRVMVTGGDDKKVNLWAVGKQSCFMSLSGHSTPIECVQFNHVEELVCAGSRAGALKVWDLEAAKLVRTLNGHKYSIKCTDFHPYGDFLASGSSDTSIKMWDSRKKGCIFTYNGHKLAVNSIKFSPDGQWIASGGEDASVKIWDLRVGRVLKDFTHHENAVTCVEFHPHEFLLASGSMDRSVHFLDLENFNLVSTEKDVGYVRCLCFNPDGECLFVGVRDYLKVIGWEPNRLYDSVAINWGRICDISTAQNQLVGASFHLTNVMVYVADLTKIQPFGGTVIESSPSPFNPNQSIRKSFSKAERPISIRNKTTLDVKTIEESTSGTDPEEESSADITNIKDYNEIFKGRSLLRTPPPEPEPFKDPDKFTSPQILTHIHSESFEALSLDNNINCRQSPPPTINNTSPYSRSKSNLDQVYITRQAKQDRENVLPNHNDKPKLQPAQKYNLQRQSSCKEVPEKISKNNNNNNNNNLIKHSVSEANISKTVSSRNVSRRGSFSKTSRNSSVPNVSNFTPKIAVTNTPRYLDNKSIPVKPIPIIPDTPVSVYVNSKLSPSPEIEKPFEEIVPVSIDRPVGLDLDDFLPKTHQPFGIQQQMPEMSEAEVMGILARGYEPMMSILRMRQRNHKVVLAQYRTKDIKTAMEVAIGMSDLAVIVDLLGVFNLKYTLWNLDLCVTVLPTVQELLQSKFETYMTTGLNTVKLILKHFGSVIKTNMQTPVGSFGVDLSREERYTKAVRCHDILISIKSYLLKKQTVPGSLGSTFREIHSLIQNTFD